MLIAKRNSKYVAKIDKQIPDAIRYANHTIIRLNYNNINAYEHEWSRCYHEKMLKLTERYGRIKINPIEENPS